MDSGSDESPEYSIASDDSSDEAPEIIVRDGEERLALAPRDAQLYVLTVGENEGVHYRSAHGPDGMDAIIVGLRGKPGIPLRKGVASLTHAMSYCREKTVPPQFKGAYPYHHEGGTLHPGDWLPGTTDADRLLTNNVAPPPAAPAQAPSLPSPIALSVAALLPQVSLMQPHVFPDAVSHALAVALFTLKSCEVPGDFPNILRTFTPADNDRWRKSINMARRHLARKGISADYLTTAGLQESEIKTAAWLSQFMHIPGAVGMGVKRRFAFATLRKILHNEVDKVGFTDAGTPAATHEARFIAYSPRLAVTMFGVIHMVQDWVTAVQIGERSAGDCMMSRPDVLPDYVDEWAPDKDP